MPLRKSHLYSSLWQSCDQLRGGMDASQYKDYILTLLFMKYVSDKYAGDDDFADITVPPGGSFADMVALKGTKEIGDGINKVIGKLADANDFLLKGVIDQADFNDETKLGKGKERPQPGAERRGYVDRFDVLCEPPAKNVLDKTTAYLLHLVASPQQHRQGRDHHAARRPLPRQP